MNVTKKKTCLPDSHSHFALEEKRTKENVLPFLLTSMLGKNNHALNVDHNVFLRLQMNFIFQS